MIPDYMNLLCTFEGNEPKYASGVPEHLKKSLYSPARYRLWSRHDGPEATRLVARGQLGPVAKLRIRPLRYHVNKSFFTVEVCLWRGGWPCT